MLRELQRVAESLDVPAARRIWQAIAPHLPQPGSDHEVRIMLHHARTQSADIAFKYRAYSHKWLNDHNIESGLPDDLKPRAERLYPRVVSAVGIGVKAFSPVVGQIAGHIRKSMEDAVLEADADGRLEDSAFVRARMAEAKTRTVRKLVGI
jgi:hypothetical protein